MCKAKREYLQVCKIVGLTNVQVIVRGKHWAFVADEGTVIAAKTPSDHRNLKNFRAEARRMKRDATKTND